LGWEVATLPAFAKRGDLRFNTGREQFMTRSVQELLDRFDRLADSEKHEAASEILQRVRRLDLDPITDDDLILSAEEMFLELDRSEEANERA